MAVGSDSKRYRVQSIFTRLDDEEDTLFTLMVLVKEEFLLLEQFTKLSQLEDVDLPAIAAVIKETKIGEGLKFLQRTLVDLTKTLHITSGTS